MGPHGALPGPGLGRCAGAACDVLYAVCQKGPGGVDRTCRGPGCPHPFLGHPPRRHGGGTGTGQTGHLCGQTAGVSLHFHRGRRTLCPHQGQRQGRETGHHPDGHRGGGRPGPALSAAECGAQGRRRGRTAGVAAGRANRPTPAIYAHSRLRYGNLWRPVYAAPADGPDHVQRPAARGAPQN